MRILIHHGSMLHLNQQAEKNHILFDISEEMILATSHAKSGHASGEIIAGQQCNNEVSTG